MIPISAPHIDDDSIQAVIDVLRSGSLAQGKKVEEFEAVFASFTGTKYAIATNNGTTALHTAFLAAGIGKGDEIITSPFTFIASANAALYCDAKPVFADIEPDTFNLDPDDVIRKITSKTKGIEIVHLYGQPCDMDRFIQICQRHGLILIEDACQAHGAEYKGKKVGSFGTGCFSFYPIRKTRFDSFRISYGCPDVCASLCLVQHTNDLKSLLWGKTPGTGCSGYLSLIDNLRAVLYHF